MIQILKVLKAPTIEETKLASKNMDEESKKHLPYFLNDVFEQINIFIKNNNFVENNSPTIEFKWEWYKEHWKNKITNSMLYGEALSTIKEELKKSGWYVFYSGGGDRVYYFSLTPESMKIF